jgi:exodeoxyribonuclease V beta subunit
LDDVLENKYSYKEINTEKNRQKAPKLLPKDFLISQAWHRTSFTGIAKNLEHSDYQITLPKNEKDIPAGKRMGILLHSIFENLDFKAPENEINKTIESKLRGYKEFSKDEEYGNDRKQWVANQIKVILHKELPGKAGQLCKVDPNSKVTELDFLMTAENIKLTKLKEILADYIPDFENEELLANYIKGSIDVVFLGADGKYYILDWKSNNLGDYSQAEIEKAMLHHGYHLQYLIYAAALKRWLEKTHKIKSFYEQFGGVYYIFIRGVENNKENANGIYYAESEKIINTIEDLDKMFRGDYK